MSNHNPSPANLDEAKSEEQQTSKAVKDSITGVGLQFYAGLCESEDELAKSFNFTLSGSYALASVGLDGSKEKAKQTHSLYYVLKVMKIADVQKLDQWEKVFEEYQKAVSRLDDSEELILSRFGEGVKNASILGQEVSIVIKFNFESEQKKQELKSHLSGNVGYLGGKLGGGVGLKNAFEKHRYEIRCQSQGVSAHEINTISKFSRNKNDIEDLVNDIMSANSSKVVIGEQHASFIHACLGKDGDIARSLEKRAQCRRKLSNAISDCSDVLQQYLEAIGNKKVNTGLLLKEAERKAWIEDRVQLEKFEKKLSELQVSCEGYGRKKLAEAAIQLENIIKDMNAIRSNFIKRLKDGKLAVPVCVVDKISSESHEKNKAEFFSLPRLKYMQGYVIQIQADGNIANFAVNIKQQNSTLGFWNPKRLRKGVKNGDSFALEKYEGLYLKPTNSNDEDQRTMPKNVKATFFAIQDLRDGGELPIPTTFEANKFVEELDIRPRNR